MKIRPVRVIGGIFGALLVLYGVAFVAIEPRYVWSSLLVLRERISFGSRSPDSIAAIIASAEAEGAAYPRPSVGLVGTDTIGTTSSNRQPRRCVDAGGKPEARSGDVRSGSWTHYRTSWMEGGGKLWWQVSSPPRPREITGGVDSSKMIVRALRLDRPLRSGAERNSVSNRIHLRPVSRHGDTVVFTMREEGTVQGFASGVRLSTPGRWMLIATYGDNWGCVVYTL